jgi:predicted glycosyltransferase
VQLQKQLSSDRTISRLRKTKARHYVLRHTQIDVQPDGLALNQSILPKNVVQGNGRRSSGEHQRAHVRILMYSHDTFGLGHLRRCRTIAHSLVEAFKGVHVLIISGSQIAGAFDFKARVDFVKIPSVIKLYNGEYTSIGQHINIEETIEWRTKIIRSTAESFEPDIFIVDKEPLGLKRELLPTLEYLKRRLPSCRRVARHP